MNKKARKQAAAERVLPEQIKESAQQLWHAGKGAITRAHQEGNRVFEALVREGETIRNSLKTRTRGVAEASVGDVTARATDTWDKLEQVFEKRVARALGSLGVPTRGELAALNKRLDALNAAVAKLSGNATSSRRATGPAKAKPAADKAAPAAKTRSTTKAATKPATKRASRSSAA